VLVCALLGALFTLFSAQSAQADAPGLSVTFSFKCDVSGQPLAEWTVTNNDLLAHDLEYDFKLDNQYPGSSTVDHLNAGQADTTGSFPVPDGKNFVMIVVENQQVIANSGEHTANVAAANCFGADLPPNPPPVSPTFEFFTECHPAGALFEVKATSNDGLEHKMQLLVSTGGPPEVADAAFWLVAGSPTAHSGVGIAPNAGAKLFVEENGTVLAESPWLQVDANEPDCSKEIADPNSFGSGDEAPADQPASEPAPPVPDPAPPAPHPAPTGHVEVQSTGGLPRTGVGHLTVEALTGTTLVLLGYALIRLARRGQTI
jgi:hypothetical protein